MRCGIMKLFVTSMLFLAATSTHAELPTAAVTSVKQALSSGKPTIIDLGARTCIPCKKMAPILESLSIENRGKANILFIDIREDQTASDRFRVTMIPTQIFFDTKGKEVKRHMGFMDKQEIIKELKAAGLK